MRLTRGKGGGAATSVPAAGDGGGAEDTGDTEDKADKDLTAIPPCPPWWRVLVTAAYNRRMAVVLGLERLLDSPALDGARVGIVCNPASVDHGLRHIADRLAAHPSARLAAIFGPQHGFRSEIGRAHV